MIAFSKVKNLSQTKGLKNPLKIKIQKWIDPDFYSAQLDGDSLDMSQAMEHYLSVGWKMGFDPSASFSTLGYLRAFPDVAISELSPLLHYLLYGKAEGRNVIASDFVRRNSNSDALNQEEGPLPVAHVEISVQRSPEDEHFINLISDFIDLNFYNKQIGENFFSTADAAENYLNEGMQNNFDPSPNFSTVRYLSLNPDVALAKMNPLLHYVMYGKKEGRQAPSSMRVFDVDGDTLEKAVVLAAHIDQNFYSQQLHVALSREDAALHYLLRGWKEGLDPSGGFSTIQYIAHNQDVKDAEMNPLFHYVFHGYGEGRVAYPSEIQS